MLIFLGCLRHIIKQKQTQNSSELPPGDSKNGKQLFPSSICMLPIRKKNIFRGIDDENMVASMATTLMETVPEIFIGSISFSPCDFE